MPKLIDVLHPYELDFIKDISSFLIFSKNIFRIASKKGLLEKKDGILIPVRWSKFYNQFVVDRGTQLLRDLKGITKENIDYYFKKDNPIYDGIIYALNAVNNNDFKDLAKNYNLIKNESKFIAFEFVNNKTNKIENKEISIYPIGLFSFIQNKKRKGLYSSLNQNSILIDNCNDLLEKIYKTNKSMISMNKRFFIKNYIDFYNKFISELKRQKWKFKVKQTKAFKNINVSRHIELNTNFCKNFYLKDHKEAINTSVVNSEYDYKEKVLLLLKINIFLGNFIIKEVFNDKDTEGFVIWDNNIKKFIKFTGNFILNTESFKKQKKDIQYNPILPGVI
tara:strand:- start:373 stop:1377 length:1005 start_codon:yes stop_codon:yes gene_type:complete